MQISKSSLFTSSYKDVFKRYSNNSIKDQARHIFKSRSFLESFKTAYLISVFSGYLTQFSTACLAGFYVFSLMHEITPNIPYRVSLVGTLVLLILSMFEASKRFVLTKISIKILTDQAPILLILTAVVLSSISLYTTLKGAEGYTITQTKQRDQILIKFDNIRQSINSKYDSLSMLHISNVKMLQARQKSRRWGLTESESQSLQSSLNEVKILRDERDEDLRENKASLKNAVDKDSQNTNDVVFQIVALCMLLEIVSYISLYYSKYYLHRVYIESHEEIETTTRNSVNPPINSGINTDHKSKIVGFKQSSDEDKKNALFLLKYIEVAEDLKRGLTYGQIRSKLYSINGKSKHLSKSTIQNVKRVMNNT